MKKYIWEIKLTSLNKRCVTLYQKELLQAICLEQQQMQQLVNVADQLNVTTILELLRLEKVCCLALIVLFDEEVERQYQSAQTSLVECRNSQNELAAHQLVAQLFPEYDFILLNVWV